MTTELQGFVTASSSPVRIYFPYYVRWDFVLRLAYIHEGGIYSSSDLLGELVSGSDRVARAKVCLTPAGGSGRPTCTTTTRFGQYFLSVPPGVYDVTVEGRGGVESKQKLDMSSAGEYRDRIILHNRP